MITVKINKKIKDKEIALQKALKLLKKKTTGLLKEYRIRRYYKKPSEIKREKRKEIERKRLLKQLKKKRGKR